METPGKDEQWIKAGAETTPQNCLCLTQHKGRVPATARQALHDCRGKLLHYPSFLAPAAPAHTTKSFPSSCHQNSTIHTTTSVDLLPSAPFRPPSHSTQPLPAVQAGFPPFSPLSHGIHSTTATPRSPGRFSQLRLSLVHLESLQHLFPAKIICTFGPLRTSSVYK